MIVIPDIIEQVVERVSNDVFNLAEYAQVKQAIKDRLSNNVTKITYLHGHPLEILQTLAERDMATGSLKFDKYPLIALFEDVDENPKHGGEYVDTTLQIIIAISTQANYKADERYEKNFNPVLTPLYDLFLKKLNNHRAVNSVYAFPHTKINHAFWGTNQQLAGNSQREMNDYVDVTEIQNLKVTFKQNFSTI